MTLTGLQHTYPDDIDILLVGPGGQNATVMSDAGGSSDVSSINVTLDDEAAQQLPDAGQLTTGSFRPANWFEDVDPFPAPAPAPSGKRQPVDVRRADAERDLEPLPRRRRGSRRRQRHQLVA